MEIALIAAIASNRAIGVNNQMPWHLSADLKRFKQLTMGFPIIMGRKTFDAIAKPLPGRTNIIISRNLSFQQPGCLVFASLEQALLAAEQLSERVFVIGGATLYQALLPQASMLYLTEIQQDFAGDTFFPEWRDQTWREAERITIDNDSSVNFSYSFVTWVKADRVS